MTRFAALFRSALVTQRRSALIWAGALALLTLSVVSVWPSMSASGSLDQLTGSLSPEVASALGLEDFGTPIGFLNGNLYAVFLPLLFGALGLVAATGLSAGDEDAGRLELLLALPVSRRSVYLSRFAAVACVLLFCSVVTALVVVGSAPAFDLDLPTTGVVAVTWSMLLLGLLHAALAFGLAGLGLRAPVVVGVTGAVLLGGYLLHAMAPLSETLQPAQNLSPWFWALGHNPLAHGFGALGVLSLVAATVIALAVGLVFVARRTIRNA